MDCTWKTSRIRELTFMNLVWVSPACVSVCDNLAGDWR